MKARLLPLMLLLVFLLTACSSSGKEPNPEATEPAETSTAPATETGTPAETEPAGETGTQPAETEVPEPEPQFFNPLTGLPIAEADLSNRPVTVMLNNLKAALPQYGVSSADIIYEVPAEGGITRMLAVYQSMEGVGRIGSVRSTRPYYLDLVQGLDGILLHAGGSDQAYADIKSRGITALDCIHGTYEGTLYWRDQSRIQVAGFEHSVFTSGEKIESLLPTYKIRLTHNDGYSYVCQFAEDGTPKNGKTANVLTVRYSTYKTGVFTYTKETGLYMVQQYGTKYIDGETGKQVGVTNVLVLFTDISLIPGDTAGRLTVDLVGGGDGLYLCGGRSVNIRWEKESSKGQFAYTLKDGTPLVFGAGKTYVNIMDTGSSVSIA